MQLRSRPGNHGASASAGALLVGLTGKSGSAPGLMIICWPFGFFQTSCPCSLLPIRTQPHWDARHTMAGKKASTGPHGFGFIMNHPVLDRATNRRAAGTLHRPQLYARNCHHLVKDQAIRGPLLLRQTGIGATAIIIARSTGRRSAASSSAQSGTARASTR